MSLRTKADSNGRPDYMQGTSVAMWEVNSKRSQMWADEARRRAHRRAKWELAVMVLVSWLVVSLLVYGTVDLIAKAT